VPQANQSPTKKMVFWLHPDQEEIVTFALNHMKETVPTKYPEVALEYICQNYLGAGFQFQNWKQALTHARKHAPNSLTLAQQVLTFLKELCPELVIEATIAVKGATPEAAE
jgi:hypothetical protein